jgi:hypothetical protein
MAKIHTHYDNLKVARLAPQEVIRAAYKALSQKYHPDKNPGDEKAARIMAIVNGAYSTLSDPVRRREHDEWIAAEEWEIEWLESTRADEGRHKVRLDPGQAWEEVPEGAVYSVLRDPRWWLGLAASFVAGGAICWLVLQQPQILPAALASALRGGAPPQKALGARPEVLTPAPVRAADTQQDTWATNPASPDGATGAAGTAGATGTAGTAVAAEQALSAVKTLAVTELVVPARAPDCDSELHALVAPNGEPWPLKSGYVEGYPVGNQGDQTRLLVDNSANNSGVFVKIYDLDRRSNVRHAYIRARDMLTIDKLSAGKYEVRYQNVEVGGSPADCDVRARIDGRPGQPSGL